MNVGKVYLDPSYFQSDFIGWIIHKKLAISMSIRIKMRACPDCYWIESD